MKKIGLIVGHIGKSYTKDRGACNIHTGLCEADYNMMVLSNLIIHFDRKYPEINLYPLTYGYYKHRCQYANNIGISLLISMHLNAFIKDNVNHGEIYYKNFTQKQIEALKESREHYEKLLGIRFYIYNAENNERVLSNIRYAQMPSILVEPMFITHKDFHRYSLPQIVNILTQFYKFFIVDLMSILKI